MKYHTKEISKHVPKTWFPFQKSSLSIFISLCLLCLGIIYIFGAHRWAEENRKITGYDQDAMINYAQNMITSNYTYVGDRNRMPLYPFLLSLNHTQDLSPETMFEQGKQFNIVLSLILLSLFYLITWIYYQSQIYALLLTASIAFSLFIYKAGFVQAELLFYLLNFCILLLMYHALAQPDWRRSFVLGILVGLAHLTKASVLPMLILFLLTSLSKEIYFFFSQKQLKDRKINDSNKIFLQRIFTILLVGITFLLVIYPYIQTSKEIFGHYFYNVNATFYIWYDSWQEAKAGTRTHGDRVGWPDMPPEDIPSMQKYLREHTLEQIISRFGNGFYELFWRSSISFGYLKYVVLYTTLLVRRSSF